MIKAVSTINGRKTVILGLSFENLDRFREQPGDTFIYIKGEKLGLAFDLMIFSGVTEEEMSISLPEHLQLFESASDRLHGTSN